MNLAGRPGTHLYGYLYHRNVYQNPSLRIHSAQEQLHAEPMEHHGLRSRRFWVRLYVKIYIPMIARREAPRN